MRKKALLCGIDRYQIAGIDLRGCVNDVEAMRSVLTDVCQFHPSDVMVIADAIATKARIQAELSGLVRNAEPGDVLYFHFSGHGSNVPDQDGDEADFRDEVFCSTDLNWQDPLRDDWIRELFDTLQDGVNLTVVTDCCHSGTITRSLYPPDATTVSRYLPCPRDLWAVESGRDLSGEIRSVPRGAGAPRSAGPGLSEVLITGCASDQTSAEVFVDGEYCGALTHSLVRAIREADGTLSYRDLHARVSQLLAEGGFAQTPQLEGEPEKFDRPFLASWA